MQGVKGRKITVMKEAICMILINGVNGTGVRDHVYCMYICTDQA